MFLVPFCFSAGWAVLKICTENSALLLVTFEVFSFFSLAKIDSEYCTKKLIKNKSMSFASKCTFLYQKRPKQMCMPEHNHPFYTTWDL